MPRNLQNLTPLLFVFDMPESIAFYRDTLQFDIVDSSPEVAAPEGRYFHWAWLRNGEANLMLNTAYDAGQRPPARASSRGPAYGCVCLYIGCSDVDQIYAELQAKGLALKPPADAPYGMRQLCLPDPDGYLVCFQHPVRSETNPGTNSPSPQAS